MSPREELLTAGRLGEAGAVLLYGTVRLVAISRRFPPPEGQQSWDEAGFQTVAHEFLQGVRGPKRLLDIAVRSSDDRSFERLLEAAVHNHFRDVARATDFGKLVLRVKEMLRSASEFLALRGPDGERWALAGGEVAASTTSPAELAAATRRPEVIVPKWSSATRDAPLADRDSIVRLITAVLIAADGSLPAVDIAHALTTRLDHRHVPLTVELDNTDGVSEPAAPVADPASQTVSAIKAVEVFDALTDRERIIVVTLDLNVRDLGSLIGTGKSQAAHLRQRVLERVSGELDDDDDSEETVSALVHLCQDWLRQRTADTDATFR